jgi:diguanylate cyclase (GGDEF)-like protein
MRQLQWRLQVASTVETLSGLKRLGIVARLSISFVAVAVLAVAANFLAGRSYIMHTTRVEQVAPMLRPAAVTEAPVAAPAPAPTTASAPISVDTALEYSRTLQRFAAALWQRAAAADVAADAEYRNASAHLVRTGARLSAEVAGADRDLARKVLGKNKDVDEGALALIALADERHRVLEDYRQHLDQLNQSMKGALDGSFKIFGRFIAREYLLKLDQNLQNIRARLEDAIASDAAPASLLALEASEREYSIVLDANRSSLEHVQGQPWLQATLNELSVLVGFRESLQRSHELYGEQRTKLTQQMSDAAVLAEECIASMQNAQRVAAALVRPAAAPLARAAEATPPAAAPAPVAPAVADSAPPPETTTITPSNEGRYALFVKITISVVTLVFIVSLLTALSIVRPVRRLVVAAAKLAAGQTHIRVERGGMKELDQLAGSFNQMAQDLEIAGDASRSYQARLEDEVAARTTQLRQLAERDPLTQLPNRRYGLTLMQRSVDQARSQNRFMGVCFVDLDNFKSINDSLGHAFGDQVLAKVAERLIEVCSSFGAAVRLGGDEFCVIHHAAQSFDEIHRSGSQLVQAFHAPLQIEQRELMVSISCGLSVFPLHGDSCAELLSSADAALYRAKSMGRNQASIYTADLLESAAERFSTEQRLRRAIERNEFELVFQPEVGVDSLRVGLVEALLRWRQPDGRLAAPGEFLAVAEASGFIAEIDRWVLNAALEAASEWHHGVWPEARVAINVSSRQLLDPRFVDRLKEMMAQHRLPPACVEIELTENVIQTGAATVATLHALKAEGFAIALDDFGTGFSSLTSLAQLPLSRVKLDRSLIAGHASDERSAAIARTTVMLCEHLQLEVTAEGIENAAQLQWLLNHDSVYLQGYLISRPLRFDDVAPSMDSIHQKMALHVLSLRTDGPGVSRPDDFLPVEEVADHQRRVRT